MIVAEYLLAKSTDASHPLISVFGMDFADLLDGASLDESCPPCPPKGDDDCLSGLADLLSIPTPQSASGVHDADPIDDLLSSLETNLPGPEHESGAAGHEGMAAAAEPVWA